MQRTTQQLAMSWQQFTGMRAAEYKQKLSIHTKQTTNYQQPKEHFRGSSWMKYYV